MPSRAPTGLFALCPPGTTTTEPPPIERPANGAGRAHDFATTAKPGQDVSSRSEAPPGAQPSRALTNALVHPTVPFPTERLIT